MVSLGGHSPDGSLPATERRPGERPAGKHPTNAPRQPPTKHYVSPRQLVASNAMIHETIVDFSAVAHDGRSLDWEKLGKNRPVVLVFVKAGCPCNVEFAPFFQRLERTYGEAVQFASVIDADVRAASLCHGHASRSPGLVRPRDRGSLADCGPRTAATSPCSRPKASSTVFGPVARQTG